MRRQIYEDSDVQLDELRFPPSRLSPLTGESPLHHEMNHVFKPCTFASKDAIHRKRTKESKDDVIGVIIKFCLCLLNFDSGQGLLARSDSCTYSTALSKRWYLQPPLLTHPLFGPRSLTRTLNSKPKKGPQRQDV